MERKRQLQKREFGKRFSLDSSLVVRIKIFIYCIYVLALKVLLFDYSAPKYCPFFKAYILRQAIKIAKPLVNITNSRANGFLHQHNSSILWHKGMSLDSLKLHQGNIEHSIQGLFWKQLPMLYKIEKSGYISVCSVLVYFLILNIGNTWNAATSKVI